VRRYDVAKFNRVQPRDIADDERERAKVDLLADDVPDDSD
jgi:hypothetical protein